MNKITEIIPGDLPEWATKAMLEGNFFRVAVSLVEERANKNITYEVIKENKTKSCASCDSFQTCKIKSAIYIHLIDTDTWHCSNYAQGTK